MPGLIWNMMISMSGGWFMIVFSEAITVGDTTVTLPGVGSYIAKANEQGRWDAIFAAVVTMALVILCYDQLFFRPIVAWAGKFRVELSASQTGERSWVLDVLHAHPLDSHGRSGPSSTRCARSACCRSGPGPRPRR